MPGTPGLIRILRNKFVAGLIIAVPIVITVQALRWLFAFIDEFAEPLAVRLVGREIPGIGFATTMVVVLATGMLFSRGPLRRLLDGLEEVIEYVPLVGVASIDTAKNTLLSVSDAMSMPIAKKRSVS